MLLAGGNEFPLPETLASWEPWTENNGGRELHVFATLSQNNLKRKKPNNMHIPTKNQPQIRHFCRRRASFRCFFDLCIYENRKKGSEPRAERHTIRPHVAFARNDGPMWPIGNWFTDEKPSPSDWIRTTHAAATLNTRALSAAHFSDSACAPQAMAIKWSSGLGFQGAGSLAGAQPVRHKSWCHSFARPCSKGCACWVLFSTLWFGPFHFRPPNDPAQNVSVSLCMLSMGFCRISRLFSIKLARIVRIVWRPLCCPWLPMMKVDDSASVPLGAVRKAVRGRKFLFHPTPQLVTAMISRKNMNRNNQPAIHLLAHK